MNEAEWTEKFCSIIMKKAGLDKDQANDVCKAWKEAYPDEYLEDDPAECVDEELSCWGD